MFSFITEKLDKIAVQAEEKLVQVSAALHPGITPISKDKRLVICGFLGDPKKVNFPSNSLSACPVDHLTKWLSLYQKNAQYVIWNLSGETYECKSLQENIVDYQFRGLPCPPVGLLKEIVTACVNWLNTEDGSNVAILHDISGRRSAVVAACILVFQTKNASGNLEMPVVAQDDVIHQIANVLGRPGTGIVPSQFRYFKYFLKYARGEQIHNNRALVFQRLIMNGIPDFVNSHGPTSDDGKEDRNQVKISPYLKIYKNNILVAKFVSNSEFQVEEGCCSLIPQPVLPTNKQELFQHSSDVVLTGDVYMKVYHQVEHISETVKKGRVVPMFSFMFNADYVDGNVLRLTKSEVDGAVGNARFPDSFFLDLIFTAANEEQVKLYSEREKYLVEQFKRNEAAAAKIKEEARLKRIEEEKRLALIEQEKKEAERIAKEKAKEQERLVQLEKKKEKLKLLEKKKKEAEARKEEERKQNFEIDEPKTPVVHRNEDLMKELSKSSEGGQGTVKKSDTLMVDDTLDEIDKILEDEDDDIGGDWDDGGDLDLDDLDLDNLEAELNLED